MNHPLLAEFVQHFYLPSLNKPNARELGWRTSGQIRARARQALAEFLAVAGEQATTRDLTEDNYIRFRERLRGLSSYRQYALRRHLQAIWAIAQRLGFVATDPPYDPPRSKRPRGPVSVVAIGEWTNGRAITLPAPLPGTVRHFFETVYKPQRLLQATDQTLENFRTLFITFWKWKGRDLLVSELNDDIAAAYFAWLLEQGGSAWSVNRQRAYLFSIWRVAIHRRLVEAMPSVPKLKVRRNAPDSWTMAELETLLRAAAEHRPGWAFDGVPIGPMMAAMILINFYTALRRRSLVEIRREDVELTTGVITVRGYSMKTYVGKRYRVPGNVVAAIRNIWLPERELLFPISPDYALSQMRLIFKRSGLKRSIHRLGLFHKVRRTAATQACVIGGVKEASQLLGHSQEYVTALYIDPAALPDNATGLKLPTIGAATNRLDDARQLLNEGKVELAAMAARIWLERSLAEQCRRTGKPMDGRGLAAMTNSLAGRGVITKEDAGLLAAVMETANCAAHGRHVEPADVAELIRIADRFAKLFI